MNFDELFLGMCDVIAQKSKDPSLKLGVVITTQDHVLLSMGYNGFPRGVREELYHMSDTCENMFKSEKILHPGALDPERWEKRPEKYRWVEHAERNAVYNAARNGIRLLGAKMYINAYPRPCGDCTRAAIQAGIVEIIGRPEEKRGTGEGVHWHAGDIEDIMLDEAGVKRRVVPRG